MCSYNRPRLQHKAELQLAQDTKQDKDKDRQDQTTALRQAALRAEQQRALDLLQKEKATAAALAADADEKLRKSEAAGREVIRRENEIRRRLEIAEEKVSANAVCS